jgi:uncharacterized RDD family membrane protein YckC
MDAINADKICPLCGKDEHMGTKARPLYGHLVCQKCHSNFVNRRQLAYGIDVLLLTAITYLIRPVIVTGLLAVLFGVAPGILIGISGIGDSSGISGTGYFEGSALFLWILYLIVSLSFFFKDGFRGCSPGKAIMGIQVINITSGKAAGFWSSFKRNLPLIIPFMPVIIDSRIRKGNRIGDGWANTRVIWKKYNDKAPFMVRNGE